MRRTTPAALLALVLAACGGPSRTNDDASQPPTANVGPEASGASDASDVREPCATPPPPAITSAAMRKLAFLAGRWAGSGSIVLGPGAEHTFRQVETIEPRLDGVTFTVEGIGRASDPQADAEGDAESGATGEPGAIVHHAFAVIFHEPLGGYRIRAFTKDGRTLETDLVVEQRTLSWSFTAAGRTTRYTIEVSGEDRWTEIGETSTDGTSWRPFLEMELERLTAPRATRDAWSGAVESR